MKEFDIFFEVANEEAERLGQPNLDPNDSGRIMYAYESLIMRGDRNAIWKFYVFEVNLMAETDEDCMDPEIIDEKIYPEAQSVAFFETRLFLRHGVEEPIDLVGRLGSLTGGIVL